MPSLLLSYCRFVDNEGDAGGAVSANQWSLDRARVEVHGSYFSGNQVSCRAVHGSLLAAHMPTSPRLRHACRAGCCLQGFQEAGAIYMNENFESDVIVNSTVFEGNWGVYGGALSLYDSNILVTNCAFTNNTVRQRQASGELGKSLLTWAAETQVAAYMSSRNTDNAGGSGCC